MTYMIDGHNLIGKLPDISLDDPNDEALLVQKLSSFAARTGKNCLVVFDHGLPGGSSRMSTRSVQVVFASGRSSADRVMVERIYKIQDIKGWVIVTSDNDVMARARRRGMETLHSEEFARMMEAPPPKIVDAGEATDVNLSETEVDEWLNLFSDGAAPKKK
ncbi:MAG: NYN domain-containing protein [Chloroflexi bacterium]|nr:NYN domain-containing protein [Chloroflexota bacterium]MCC6894377.1 NYN domain-containing protein [Anaerolineae bacterium]